MGKIKVVCDEDPAHIAYILEGQDLDEERPCREDECLGYYHPAYRQDGSLVITKCIPTSRGKKAVFADTPKTRRQTQKSDYLKRKREEDPKISNEKLKQGLENVRPKKRIKLDHDDAAAQDSKEDDEFISGGDWNPDWRLTVGGTPYSSRDQSAITPLIDSNHDKPSKLHTITNAPPVRGGTDAKMGGSAVDTARGSGRRLAPPKLAKHATNALPPAAEEWCHLIAHSLGGKVKESNLVAASHACNTYMASVESFLKGRSDLSIRVTAFCSAPHVAEQIKYEVFKKNVPKWSKLIDARATAFTKEDKIAIMRDLKQALGKPKRGF